MIFSIIITSFNYGSFIEEAINSAITQDFDGEYEVIVVDDNSTDNTASILDAYDDDIVRVNNSVNKGIEVSSNNGIKIAKGKYVVRLDADDYISNIFLSSVYQDLNPKDTFYYSGYFKVSQTSEILSTVQLLDFNVEEIKCRGDFLASGTVYLKQTLYEVGLYNESNINCGLENYDLILALISKGFTGKYINKILFSYRRHGKNISLQKRDAIFSYGQYISNKYQLMGYKVNQYHPYLETDVIMEKYHGH